MAISEMEKRADGADASVLIFPHAVLIFWLLTRKVANFANFAILQVAPSDDQILK